MHGLSVPLAEVPRIESHFSGGYPCAFFSLFLSFLPRWNSWLACERRVGTWMKVLTERNPRDEVKIKCRCLGYMHRRSVFVNLKGRYSARKQVNCP